MTIETVFIGSAPFGLSVLDELYERDEIELKGVISQPDREQGRGQEVRSTPISERARELGLPLEQPEDINKSGLDFLRQFPDLEIIFIVAYGQLLDREFFSYPEEETFNFHASLLPRWRGAAPIRHSLLAGDDKTGVTLFRLTEALDAGPICARRELTVGTEETYGELYRRLKKLNVQVLDDFLDDYRTDSLECQPQTGEPTYASQIDSETARIDWSEPAEQIERQVRAFCPGPGAYTEINGERCKIYAVEQVETTGRSGEILAADKQLIIAADEAALRVKKIQPAGSEKMEAASFLAGRQQLEPGNSVN